MHEFVVLRNKYIHSSIHDEVEGFKKKMMNLQIESLSLSIIIILALTYECIAGI